MYPFVPYQLSRPSCSLHPVALANPVVQAEIDLKDAALWSKL